MEKKHAAIDSYSIDGPLIEVVDEQVPYDPASERSSKPQTSAKRDKADSVQSKKKPHKRRKK